MSNSVGMTKNKLSLTTSELLAELRDDEEWASFPMRIALRRRAADEIERLMGEQRDLIASTGIHVTVRAEQRVTIERLQGALNRLTAAVGALMTPDHELCCLPEGPERRELETEYLAALSRQEFL